ncbi:MAG: anhydro-N-acetylmuramic acid kinase [Legionellaceae bacterium]|nr:anhydro-N-acetylmuramic acid kinase [Legionellaceae bacterium]
MSLYIGLMSGTSMDGMDAALVDFSNNTLVAGITRPYSQEIQTRLSNFNQAELISPIQLMQLHALIGQDFAKAVFDVLKKANCKSENVSAIGSHGQTLYHDPLASIPTTLQLGCAHTIAAQTGITTVADFRTRDLVLGGQGAPFAPCFHHILFENQDLPLVLVNIGGIANITILRKNNPPIGYDTGPGNTLMDAWIKKHRNVDYDAHGAWASTGQIIQPLLERLLEDSYFKKASPKSIGTEYFSEAWLLTYLESSYLPEDVQATLAKLTAISIANAIKVGAPECHRIALCGGGVHNDFLSQQLKQALPTYSIDSTEAFGVDPDYLEAIMFGWFAKQAIQNKIVDMTQITGAHKPTILGSIYPK